MAFPVFAPGDVLNASDMNAVGLWLVKKQTIGSAVSSVAVTGAFSADYENYRIIITGSVLTSGNASVNMTLGASSASYYYGGFLVTQAGGTSASSANNTSSWIVGRTSTLGTMIVMDVFRPNVAARTQFSSTSHLMDTTAANGYWNAISGFHDVATAYTGFTLTPGASTLTGGTIRVYGYRD